MDKSDVAAEVAKATAELAKAANRGLDLVAATGHFFEQILGPGFNHLGGSFSDWAAVFRHSNALKLSAKVDALHKERGLSGQTRPIHPRLAIPLIQAATIEDDENLQGLWAGLIANATDPNKLTEARRDFVVLLGALEPLDARCLMEIQKNQAETVGLVAVDLAGEVPLSRERSKRNVGWLAECLGVPSAAVQLSVEGLARNGLIIDRMEDPDDNQAGSFVVPATHREADLWLTFTAEALLRACAVA